MTCTTHHDACECREKEHADEVNRLKEEIAELGILARHGIGFPGFLIHRLKIPSEKFEAISSEYAKIMNENYCESAREINNMDLTPYLNFKGKTDVN